jgi:hypothetical protein
VHDPYAVLWCMYCGLLPECASCPAHIFVMPCPSRACCMWCWVSNMKKVG